MQKLQAKLKNTPRNTSLVPCSVSSGLNKDETLSDQSKVLTCNNSEENHQQHRAGSSLRVLNTVYVLNKRSQPLMPTCQSRARKLLSNGKAKVVKRYSFTIQLVNATGEDKQDIVLGIDMGYQKVGLSAVSNNHELFSAEATLRKNIVKLLSEKSMYRRTRRSQHHWYRKPRFNNRKKSNGWLAPSIRHKVDSHVGIAEKISKLLPISKIEKTHINDAFVIANGTKQTRNGNYVIGQKRKNNRALQLNRKGFKPSVRRRRYKIQPSDFVEVKEKEYIAKGIFCKGRYVKVKDKNGKTYNFKTSLVENHFCRGTWLWN